jgi:large subunit ribosomal protein L35
MFKLHTEVFLMLQNDTLINKVHPEYERKISNAKMKTLKGLKKRVKLTKNGKIKRAHANSQHKATYADASNAAVIKKLLPYNQ